MDKVTLTVYFDDPFWVGVFERVENGKLSACKVTFGAEPRDVEVLEFVQNCYAKLRFSPTVDARIKCQPSNPKRMQREARRQTLDSGAGTKAQQALQLQREAMKTERKVLSREQKLSEQKRKYELKLEKRRQKHRGK